MWIFMVKAEVHKKKNYPIGFQNAKKVFWQHWFFPGEKTNNEIWIFRPPSLLIFKVSCTVPNVGAAGGPQNHNGLCVLSQNVINEKMYLAVWFWTVLLIFIVPFFIIYRLCIIMFTCLRSGLLISKYQLGVSSTFECLKNLPYSRMFENL